LQTPLAICRSKLELLAQGSELTENQAELVASLFSGIERISRLNKNLLLLSRIENRQFLELEELNLSAVVEKHLEVFSNQRLERSIQVDSTLDNSAIIKTNPVLLDVLISNLISNAVRHSCDGSTINIEGNREYFMISNPGEPLLNPDKVFERFHREARVEVGNGLGLSIVKKICDVTGYRLGYNYNDTRHHFRVAF
jgi:K+-sensing histidine kinase KdpD